MVQPPTWALTVANAMRYIDLRPWQPRLSLDGTVESLPQRVQRLRAAWAGSRLSDGEGVAEFGISTFVAAYKSADITEPPADRKSVV